MTVRHGLSGDVASQPWSGASSASRTRTKNPNAWNIALTRLSHKRRARLRLQTRQPSRVTRLAPRLRAGMTNGVWGTLLCKDYIPEVIRVLPRVCRICSDRAVSAVAADHCL